MGASTATRSPRRSSFLFNSQPVYSWMISKTRRLRCLSGQTLVSFFRNTQFDALVARQRDVSFAALTDDEDVVQSRGEKMTKSILNVDNIEGAGVTFTVDDGTDSTQIASAGNHGDCQTRT